MIKVCEFKRRYHLHERYLCLVHWIHNMLLKKEDTSGELHNNSKTLVNTRSVNKVMRLPAYRMIWQYCGLALHMKVR